MSIKILITDPLSESGFKILQKENFEIIYKPKIDQKSLINIISDIDGWIIRSGTTIKEDHIRQAHNLQIIGRAGVGTDNIDKQAATKYGIIVMNVPDGNTISAAEHTLAMLMTLSRNIQLGHMGLMKGSWDRHLLVGNELRGKFLGVVGLGKIGREVIKRALSFDMKILGYDPYINQEQFNKDEVKVVDLDYLTKNSDYITLHVPLNDATRDLFDYKQLSKMKSNARIVNVARGGIINESDLSKILNSDKIAGAAIDVYTKEPIDKDNPLLHCKNILLTPHLGASTIEAKENVTATVCNQLIEYFNNNKLINALNIPIADPSLFNKFASFYILAEKIGIMQSQLSQGPIKDVKVTCFGKAEDSKSIALAFLKGLLGGFIDNRVNFINADTVAKERGINFHHIYSNDELPYSNMIKIEVVSDESISISGSVYDENHIRIVDIMGFKIDLEPSGVMLFVKNKDVPGVVGKVGTLLGKSHVNIKGYLLSKIKDKDFAYAVIKLEDKIKKSLIADLNQLSSIQQIKQISI